MSRAQMQILLNALGPELLVAQSEMTAMSETVIDRPVNVHGFFMSAPTTNHNTTQVFDGNTTDPKIRFGSILLTLPGAQLMFTPGFVSFDTNVGIAREGVPAQTVIYTIFYTEK